MPNKRGNWFDDQPGKRINRHGSKVTDDDVEGEIREKVPKQYQQKVLALYRICEDRGAKMMYEYHHPSSIMTKPQYPNCFYNFIKGMRDNTHAWLLQKVDGFRGYATMETRREGDVIRIESTTGKELWAFPFKLGEEVRGSNFKFIGELYLQVKTEDKWVTVNHWGMTLYQAFLRKHRHLRDDAKYRVRFGVFWLHSLAERMGNNFVSPKEEPQMLLRAMLENDDGSPVDPDFHLIRAYGRLLKGSQGVTYQVRTEDGTFEDVTTIPNPLALYDYLLEDCEKRRWEGAVAYDPNREYDAKKIFDWFRPTNQVKIKGIYAQLMCAKFLVTRERADIVAYYVYAMDGSGDDEHLRMCGRLDLTRQTNAIKSWFEGMSYYQAVRHDEVNNYYKIRPKKTDRMQKIRTQFTGFTANFWLVGNRAVEFLSFSKPTRIQQLRTPYHEEWRKAYVRLKCELRMLHAVTNLEREHVWFAEAERLADELGNDKEESGDLPEPRDGPLLPDEPVQGGPPARPAQPAPPVRPATLPRPPTPPRPARAATPPRPATPPPAIPSPDPPIVIPSPDPPSPQAETQVWDATGRRSPSLESRTQRMSISPNEIRSAVDEMRLRAAGLREKRRLEQEREWAYVARMQALIDKDLPPGYSFPFLGGEYAVPQKYKVDRFAKRHVEYLLGDMIIALTHLASAFKKYQERASEDHRVRYLEPEMNTAYKKLIGCLLNETLALNRPAMDELDAFVGWRSILVEDGEWFKLKGGTLCLGSAEVRELFKVFPLETLANFVWTEAVRKPPSILSAVERMEAAVLGHFKERTELNEHYFFENLRMEFEETAIDKRREFAEEIADVIGPVQMGYTHRVRHRFFSAFNDFLLSQLVRLLNEAQDRVGFAAVVSQQIQGYLQ